MIEVQQHRVLYRDPHFHAAFPSIARFSDDHLLLAFRRARSGLWLLPAERRAEVDPVERMDHIDSRSQIVLLELAPDGGGPLGRPDLMPIDPEAGDQDASLLMLPGDRVFLASFSWYPVPSDVAEILIGREPPGRQVPGCRYLPWGSHSALRGRAPGQWSAHHRYLVPDGDYGGSYGERRYLGPVRGRLLYRDGRILLACYGVVMDGCVLFASDDDGGAWRRLGTVAANQAGGHLYQEPALCDDGQGGLVCFMRTAGAGGRLATSRSADGRHWQAPRLHALVGHPFHPLALRDGRVLLTYGYREPPYGIRARLLSGPLADPDTADEVVIRADGPCPDIGYPWAVELDDGRVLVCYYWTDGDGIRHIVGSWLRVA